ncbi:conserved protein of unknown function [Caballeronia sp. S22]
MATQTITGSESFWGGIKLSANALTLINESPTLVNELLAYQAAVINNTADPMATSSGGGIFFNNSGIVFANNYQTWSDSVLVGTLAHEIGHFINFGADVAFQGENELPTSDPNAYSIDAMIGLHREGEAVYNNYVVQQEIMKSDPNGTQIYLAGANNPDGSSDGLQRLLDAQHLQDVADEMKPGVDRNWMIEDAMGIFATLKGSAIDKPYYDVYGSSRGASAQAPTPPTSISFSDPTGDGNFNSMTESYANGSTNSQYFNSGTIGSSTTRDQFGNVISQTTYFHQADGSYNADIYDAQGRLTNEDQFHADGSEVAFQINVDGSQAATVYNGSGKETEYATFGTDGKKTLDAFFDPTNGRETQENHLNADGSQVDYTLNADGSQNATVYNASGHETEYGVFGVDGKKTLDVFFDSTTGRETQENHFNADGSQTDYLLDADGSHNANVYNAAGQETEHAAYGADGKMTQDIFFDAGTGCEIQENDVNADGSQIDHVFNANGTQNAIVYSASGHETEYATYGVNGKMTQDVVFDSNTGRELQENDLNPDGSQIDHIFNANGTQNATVYNAAGHETEYATYGTNGKMTQDVYFDASTGRETQENDINADGSQVDYIFNTNGTQNAIAYNTVGHETEYASFGTNGKMTQDVFFDSNSGREMQENDINADGSQIDHIFNANGTQNATVYNASGHETEYATYGTNGKMTQDVYFDANTGRETQENDINADGSQVDHILNINGTQNAIVYNSAGHQTEQASFDTGGKLTQDIIFDGSTGRELQETDYNSSGGGVAHVFNPDGTQNSAVFDPSGHVSEYATYGKNGQITSDAYFDATGRETQLNEYSNTQTIVRTFGADNSQTATVYNAFGNEIEFAKFSSAGQKTDDYFFDHTTGRETEYDKYGNDGSMIAHLFNSDNSQDAIIFNGNGQEIEYDAFNSSGQLTGFTQFTYGAGGGYDAIAYGPTGYETGWADYGGNGMVMSSGGNAYNFSLSDDYGSGEDDWDWGAFNNDFGYGGDFGFNW